ncbi:MAG: RimK family alpha-L-glutamate ligase [Candidatus Nanohaloarchaea archaeon]
MKMVIVYGEYSTTHQLMIERAEEIFDTVLAVPADGLKFIYGPEETQVLYKGTDITEFDVAYLRHSDEEVYFAEHLAEILNNSGVLTPLSDDTFAVMTNKFYTMKILAENGLNVPDSVYTLSPDTAVEAAERLGYPIIMKTITGGGGEGVMRASSESELKPVMDTMKAFEQDICLQEYMEHSGTDNRVIVIGDHVVAYQRSSSDEGEWRSNIGAGGERLKVELTDEMRDTGIRAARAIGAGISGADIIESEDDIFVLEMNAAQFGLSEEINEIVDEDIILGIVEFLHERAMAREE